MCGGSLNGHRPEREECRVMDLEVKLNAAESEVFPFQISHIDDGGNVIWDDPVIDPKTKEPVSKVGIRSMSPFFEERISARKYIVEHVYNTKSRAMDRDRHMVDLTPDEAKQERDDAYDYAITFISGLKVQGVVVTCTRENKLALMKLPVFDRFFAKCQTALANSGIVAKEVTEKNLPSGPVT